MDISSYAGFFTALLGAIVGGLFTLLGVCLSHKKMVEREDKKSISNLINMLKAMNKEANLLVQIGDYVFSSIEKHNPENIFFYFTEITQNYFSIYDNNVHLLGQIIGEESEEYKSSIIAFYIRAKRFLETLASHSWYLNKYLEYRVYSDLTEENILCVLSKCFHDRLKTINEVFQEGTLNLKSELKNFNHYHKRYIDRILIENRN